MRETELPVEGGATSHRARLKRSGMFRAVRGVLRFAAYSNVGCAPVWPADLDYTPDRAEVLQCTSHYTARFQAPSHGGDLPTRLCGSTLKRIMFRAIVATVLSFLSFRFAIAQTAPFYLRDGDTVVFYGDSITEQRYYASLVETYVVTRFPDLKVRFVASGWGGDRVSGGGGGLIDVRLTRDVETYKPTVVTILLGMNDGHYQSFSDKAFNEYAAGYQHIIRKLKAFDPPPRLVLLRPSPYDEISRPPLVPEGYNNSVLVRYGDFLTELGKKENVEVVDLNTPVVDVLTKANLNDPALAMKIIPDRIHPSPAASLIMAETLLKAWNASPLVSQVIIDGQRRVSTKNTAVSGLDVSAGLSWSQTDRCLPMPVDLNDPVTRLVLNSSDFQDALDLETLQVADLPAGRYVLKIDNFPAGAFSADQLASGINISTQVTAMEKQAADVYRLVTRHNEIHFFLWRSVQVGLARDTLNISSAVTALNDLEDQVINLEKAAARPKPHTFSLSEQ